MFAVLTISFSYAVGIAPNLNSPVGERSDGILLAVGHPGRGRAQVYASIPTANPNMTGSVQITIVEGKLQSVDTIIVYLKNNVQVNQT
jgi:hypothetical protein